MKTFHSSGSGSGLLLHVSCIFLSDGDNNHPLVISGHSSQPHWSGLMTGCLPTDCQPLWGCLAWPTVKQRPANTPSSTQTNTAQSAGQHQQQYQQHQHQQRQHQQHQRQKHQKHHINQFSLKLVNINFVCMYNVHVSKSFIRSKESTEYF